MLRDMLYEESAIPQNAMKEEKFNKGFTIGGIICIALSLLYIFILSPVALNILGDDELDTIGKIFNVLFWASFPMLFILLGVFLLIFKKRYNVSYDYHFVEDELRISKVFNGRKRKHLKTLKCDQMLKIGSVAKDSYKRTEAGIDKKHILVMTPNDEPAKGKEFFYILYSSTTEKVLVIIEARREILEYLVRAAGRSKYEPN